MQATILLEKFIQISLRSVCEVSCWLALIVQALRVEGGEDPPQICIFDGIPVQDLDLFDLSNLVSEGNRERLREKLEEPLWLLMETCGQDAVGHRPPILDAAVTNRVVVHAQFLSNNCLNHHLQAALQKLC